VWCYWRESSYFRRDHASVFRLHGADDTPISNYWLAAPPWFGDRAEDTAIMRRRFKSPEAAMMFADKVWPEGSHAPEN
jgi:hypothetical protein